jgi:hypothetical protein
MDQHLYSLDHPARREPVPPTPDPDTLDLFERPAYLTDCDLDENPEDPPCKS